MDTVNFLMAAWAADPVPLVIAGIFLVWLWHVDPDVIMWLTIGFGVWWLFA